ncbi:MAG: hypothetical protein JWL76_1070 [Thermoleophilia bacterium]|nr:hypothetical protein [Thermoleophilia bacterium]
MVEMMVVLLIIAIISAVAFQSVKGARTSGGRSEAIAAATRYADAVDRFQQEHGRQLPKIGTPTWPVADEGPVHRLVIGSAAPIVRPYLKGSRAPEIMSKGPLTGASIVQAAGSCPSPPAEGGLLVFRVGPAPNAACGPALTTPNQFSIGVAWHGEYVCTAGDVPAARRC